MKATTGSVRLSASDLSNHLACNHLTTLDLAVATGSRSAPKWNSPDSWVLQQRGIAHENAYIQHLESQGLSILNLPEISDEASAFARTCAAVQTGVDVIVQAVLAEGEWFGRADVLRKVALSSKLGNWSYEIYDCKLALETKGATILQLSLYTELLSDIQGTWPEFMYVVPPNDEFIPEPYRVSDFAAYYRYVKRRLQSAVKKQANTSDSYPEPTEHCPVCRWWGECQERRREDDHLSLVAGISRLQRKQLNAWDVTTVEDLSVLPLPFQRRPDRGSKKGYVRVREQARMQVEGRVQQKPLYEVLPLNEEHGFYGLPEPSAGDAFFDLEGVEDGSIHFNLPPPNYLKKLLDEEQDEYRQPSTAETENSRDESQPAPLAKEQLRSLLSDFLDQLVASKPPAKPEGWSSQSHENRFTRKQE
jgi:uncharacterized protein